MPKFFTDSKNISQKELLIDGSDVIHITKVLRMGIGDEITVCDGRGIDYIAEISSTDNKIVKAVIKSSNKCEAEPNIKVTLFQCLPKQGKMEYIIQKTTELGIYKIVPVYSSRCVAKPSDKLDRWQKVALEAAKQCGRGMVPEITETVSFKEAVKLMAMSGHAVMLYEEEEDVRLKDVLQDNKFSEISILVGPEGGFAPDEALLARNSGIPAVTLGKRILRCETAAAAVLPVIMYHQGEF